MLFELFKNAMRAVIEHHGTGADDFPPLEVLLVMGTEDLVIKVILVFFFLIESHKNLFYTSYCYHYC